MKLNEILKNLECKIIGNADLEIAGIESNSLKVENGFLFICIKGFKVDSQFMVFHLI